jgi:agmatinase
VTPYSNVHTIKQIEEGHQELLHDTPFLVLLNNLLIGAPFVPLAKDGKHHPHV